LALEVGDVGVVRLEDRGDVGAVDIARRKTRDPVHLGLPRALQRRGERHALALGEEAQRLAGLRAVVKDPQGERVDFGVRSLLRDDLREFDLLERPEPGARDERRVAPPLPLDLRFRGGKPARRGSPRGRRRRGRRRYPLAHRGGKGEYENGRPDEEESPHRERSHARLRRNPCATGLTCGYAAREEGGRAGRLPSRGPGPPRRGPGQRLGPRRLEEPGDRPCPSFRAPLGGATRASLPARGVERGHRVGPEQPGRAPAGGEIRGRLAARSGIEAVGPGRRESRGAGPGAGGPGREAVSEDRFQGGDRRGLPAARRRRRFPGDAHGLADAPRPDAAPSPGGDRANRGRPPGGVCDRHVQTERLRDEALPNGARNDRGPRRSHRRNRDRRRPTLESPAGRKGRRTVMRTRSAAFVLLLLAPGWAPAMLAQLQAPLPSPYATVAQTIGVTKVEV